MFSKHALENNKGNPHSIYNEQEAISNVFLPPRSSIFENNSAASFLQYREWLWLCWILWPRLRKYTPVKPSFYLTSSVLKTRQIKIHVAFAWLLISRTYIFIFNIWYLAAWRIATWMSSDKLGQYFNIHASNWSKLEVSDIKIRFWMWVTGPTNIVLFK